MELIRLALKNISGARFRSAAIFLCVMGLASFLLTTTLIIKGSQNSLNAGIQRLGADIIVVPAGAEGTAETALLMGKPTGVWMPTAKMQEIAAIPGVQKVSPQIYLASIYGAPCCSAAEMFLVVYNPQTDFSVTPWFQGKALGGLSRGEVIGGSAIFVPKGEQGINLYGSTVNLKGNLGPTGTSIDQTLFMTLDTAQDIALSSTTAAEPLVIPADGISSIMVKVKQGVYAHGIAQQILLNTKGMIPVESPDLFGAFRSQMEGLLWGFSVLTLIMWGLAAVLMGVNFSMASDERKREMAVLRAVGAEPSFIFRLVLTEAGMLAATGAVIGISLSAVGLFFFKDTIAASLKMPLLFPSVPTLIGLFGAGLGLAIGLVILSALVPAIRISRQELAIAMRE
jgi:putative ABC transport system permease protein